MPDVRVDHGTTAYEADTLPTKLQRLVVKTGDIQENHPTTCKQNLACFTCALNQPLIHRSEIIKQLKALYILGVLTTLTNKASLSYVLPPWQLKSHAIRIEVLWFSDQLRQRESIIGFQWGTGKSQPKASLSFPLEQWTRGLEFSSSTEHQ